MDAFENLTVDVRFLLAGPRHPPRGVVIAAIDDETVKEIGAYPLPRETIAKIFRCLAALEQQVIAIDIAFLDNGKAESDADLADALRSTKSVVGAIGLFEVPRADGLQAVPDSLALVPEPSSILWPIAPVRSASRQGLVNIATDAAGIPRHIPLIYRSGDRVVPSFALATAAVALNAEPVVGAADVKLAARATSTDLGYHLALRFYGPSGSIPRLSAARVLRGDLDPDAVRGQVVLVGITALGAGDTFATPFDSITPGVEIFATGVANLLAGQGLIRSEPVREIDAAAAIVLPIMIVALLGMQRAFSGLGLAAMAICLWIAFACLAFGFGYWFSVAVPLAACVPVAAGYGAARLGFDRYQVSLLTQDKATLTRFQSPLLLDYLLAHPRFLEQPVHQDIAVLFVDLSGYTTLAESLGSKWARDLLASFQALVERDAAAEKGYVASFMGDGAMILFGLPESRPDDAERALRAAMRLKQSISDWLTALPPVGRERLGLRIGAHVGPATVSRLGPTHHQHIAATGDTVNVASRLIEIAKQQQCSVVASDSIYAAAHANWEGPPAAPVIEIDIRGRAQSLRVRTWA